MATPTIEARLGKTLRKANRLKVIQAKLEHIDELIIDIEHSLQRFSGDIEDSMSEQQQLEKRRLAAYIELCTLHKLKFQIDGLLSDVKRDIQRLARDRQLLTQAYIGSLMQRLYAVLEIDAGYLEAREILNQVQTEYPQHIAVPGGSQSSLSIAPYKATPLTFEIHCQAQELEKYELLRTQSLAYQVPHAPEESDETTCHMRFSLKDLQTFGLFHEELRIKPSYRISVNNQPIDEQHFSDWFHCYQQFLKADNPQYCYGASPLTLNMFGCHKLCTPDIAKQLDLCWFSHGTLEETSGIFLLSKQPITEQLQKHLDHCGFCPALSQKKLTIGLQILPHALNPICDPYWSHWESPEYHTHVIPTGHDIAIVPPGTDFSHVDRANLIEVGSTPYAKRVISYLASNALADLGSPGYSGLSTCPQCGVMYKFNTMTCTTCKTDFWKYALQDLEHTISRMRTTHLLDLSIESPGEALPSPQPRTTTDHDVSFDQLWDDPDIQQLLSTDPPEKMPPAQTAHPEDQHTSTTPHATPPSEQSLAQHQTPERLQFHQKIWGLISKKYRERKAIETAFSQSSTSPESPLPTPSEGSASPSHALRHPLSQEAPLDRPPSESRPEDSESRDEAENIALLNAIKNLRPKQRSELSKRGVVRVVYHATMDKEVCPLCAYLDGTVMDPDDPATDIFSPPLYPGCTCRREYVLKTEKPKNWPRVTFTFPPKELLVYLDRES